mgnify:CR=1 FL=1
MPPRGPFSSCRCHERRKCPSGVENRASVVVNSSIRRSFDPDGFRGVLPWSGVVVIWDGNEVTELSCGPSVIQVLEDAVIAGVHATEFQVFHSHDPAACRCEIYDLLVERGAKLRAGLR